MLEKEFLSRAELDKLFKEMENNIVKKFFNLMMTKKE